MIRTLRSPSFRAGGELLPVRGAFVEQSLVVLAEPARFTWSLTPADVEFRRPFVRPFVCALVWPIGRGAL